jgi:hypothetical protein
MLTRDNIRDAASTLAHHWVSAEPKDREGVERIIRSHPVPLHPVLCAHVMRYLELRGFYTKAEQFEGLLFDLAGELVEPETHVDQRHHAGWLIPSTSRSTQSAR